jgi:hypothetical protein
VAAVLEASWVLGPVSLIFNILRTGTLNDLRSRVKSHLFSLL